MSTILITGATGTIGRHIIGNRAIADHTVRAFVRQPPVEPAWGIDYHLGDFADAASLDRALDGVETVFLACGNDRSQVTFETTVIDRARAAGVRRLVKLSAHGADRGSEVAFWRWHAQIEDHLAGSGPASVVVRPHYLMSNLLAAREAAASMGMLFAPLGDAVVAMVDPRDVAEVAVRLLLDASHDGQVLTVTGGEPVGFAQVAEAYARMLDRDVRYQPVSDSDARHQMEGSGMPPAVADQILLICAALRNGAQTATTEVVTSLTGHAPRTVSDFLAYAERPPAAASAGGQSTSTSA